MSNKKEVMQFIKSQRSIQFYKNLQNALRNVLLAMPKKQYKKATNNLIIMALHNGTLAQVMHFPTKNKFKLMQIVLPKNIPLAVLEFVIAHEFGHVMQNRNWKKGDKNKLEIDADKYALGIGFSKTISINNWLKNYKKIR